MHCVMRSSEINTLWHKTAGARQRSSSLSLPCHRLHAQPERTLHPLAMEPQCFFCLSFKFIPWASALSMPHVMSVDIAWQTGRKTTEKKSPQKFGRPECKIPNSYWKPWWHGDAVTSALMVTNLQVTFRWRRMCELVVCRRISVLNIVSQDKIDIQISSPLPLKSIAVSFIAKCQENSDAHTHSPSSNPIVFYWVRFTTTRPYRVLNKRLTKSWTWDILCKYQTSLQATWKTHYQIDFHAFDTTFSLLRKDFGRVCEALNSRRGLNEMICVPCPRLLDVPVSGLRKLCRWRPRLVTEDLSFKHARTINRLISSKKG